MILHVFSIKFCGERGIGLWPFLSGDASHFINVRSLRSLSFLLFRPAQVSLAGPQSKNACNRRTFICGERGITCGDPIEGDLKPRMTVRFAHCLFCLFASPRQAWLRCQQKSPALRGHSLFGGERGIRTPGSLTFNGFQDRRNRPLCHLSGRKIRA